MRIGLARRLVLLCGVVALPTVQAMAAVNAYMTIEGSTQGSIKGGSERAGGWAGTFPLTGVVRGPDEPRDAATGMASGKRQHSVITITRKMDAASPKLARAAATGESLRQVTIVFETPGGVAGKEKVAQKIVLSDAIIAGIRNTGETETIKLAFQKIEVTYVNGNKTSTDDWETPK